MFDRAAAQADGQQHRQVDWLAHDSDAAFFSLSLSVVRLASTFVFFFF